MRSIKEIEELFQTAWNDWFAFGYFDTDKFIKWLFEQDLDILQYAFFYFDALPDKKAADLGCEYVEYAMTHRELVDPEGFFKN